MPEESEVQVIIKLIEKTEQNQVDWQLTGLAGQLTASFAGKYSILLTHPPAAVLGAAYSLKVKNADGDDLVSLTNLDDARVLTLYQRAALYARKQIDDQLDDLLHEIDNPSPQERLADRVRRAREAMARAEKK